MAEKAPSEDPPRTNQAPDGLRALARNYRDQAWVAHERFHSHAHLSFRTHLAVGITGVIAGVLAGTAAIINKHPLVAGVAAFMAAAAVALQTFLSPKKSADDNWKRSADLAEVSRKWDVIANAQEEPTQEEFDKLLEEWKKRQSP